MLRKVVFKIRRTLARQASFISTELLADFPLSPPLSLPSGYSQAQLLAWLKTVRPVEAPAAEMQRYCEQDFLRFVYTYGLAKDLSGRCLELGSGPYFTTFLLREFTELELTLANYFSSDWGAQVVQEVAYQQPQTGEMAVVPLTSFHFNLETERFPFADGAFEGVLFCEILEHLLCDPLAALREIKRVLTPNGTLILTTPNVNRLENVARMVAGENIYDPYSAYGPYGRHNREYNRRELMLMLDYLGFSITSMFTADVHQNNANLYVPTRSLQPLLSHRLKDLGQYLFIRARNDKPARAKKPSFLYRSFPETEIEDFS